MIRFIKALFSRKKPQIDKVYVGPIRIVHLRCETCGAILEDGHMVLVRNGKYNHLKCLPSFK